MIKRFSLPVVVATAIPVISLAADPQQADLEASILDLRRQVTTLESAQIAPQRHAAHAAAAVLRDAERRSTLLATGESAAGYDDGFFIRSGSFELLPSIATIFRNTTSWVDNGKNSGSDECENGFEIRRVEVEIEGTVLTRDLYYDVIWKTPAEGGSPFLDEAFAVYSFAGTPWAIKAGQFKDNIYHEETVSFKKQMAAEKSLLNEVLMGGCYDRVQGVAILHRQDNLPLRFDAAFDDGAASANTSYVDSPSDSAALEHFGASGRLEFKALGDWKDYSDFSARSAKGDLLVIGLGTHWTQGQFADGVDAAVGGDRLLSALDIQWELAGPKIGLFAAITTDYTMFNGSSVGEDRLNWGFLGQAGWALSRQWEVFARYDLIKFDDDFRPGSAEDTYHEITTGVTWFLGNEGSAGHRAKITVDMGYLPNGSPIRATNIGIPVVTDEDAIYVRAQLLLVI